MMSRQRRVESVNHGTKDAAQTAICCARTPSEGLEACPLDFLPLVIKRLLQKLSSMLPKPTEAIAHG